MFSQKLYDSFARDLAWDQHVIGACAQQVRQYLESKRVRVVDKSDLGVLGHAEEKIAQERGLTWFKFDKDEDMLAAIDANKAKTVSV